MSTDMAVWPGVYWLSDGSLFQYFSFQYWTTNHPGKHTFATSFFACFPFFFFHLLNLHPVLWWSAAIFLAFPLSSLFVGLFFFPFFFSFLLSISGLVQDDWWKSHLLIICTQSCKLSSALHASVFKCLWVCLNPFPSSVTVHCPKIPWAVSWS